MCLDTVRLLTFFSENTLLVNGHDSCIVWLELQKELYQTEQRHFPFILGEKNDIRQYP